MRTNRHWRFDLPKGGRNFRLKGSFRITSGGSRDINAYVVDGTEYVNFRSGNSFYASQHLWTTQ